MKVTINGKEYEVNNTPLEPNETGVAIFDEKNIPKPNESKEEQEVENNE